MVEPFFTQDDVQEDKSVVDMELCQQMVGFVLHLGIRSCPDILVVVLVLARFQIGPTAVCHRGIKRVLRFVRGTNDFAFCT